MELTNGMRLALCAFHRVPALRWRRRSRPTGKMLRPRKKLGIAPDSPASGVCFVGRRFEKIILLLVIQNNLYLLADLE